MTTGLIASAHGRFIGIQLVAPVCIPPNTCLLRTTRVHNPNGISIGSAFFAQLTQCRRGCPSMCFPLKIAHWRIGRSGPYLIHGSLAHPNPKPERHLDRFSRFCRAAERGRLNRIRHVAPMYTPCNTGFLWPTRVHNPNGKSISSAILHSSLQSVVGHSRACPFL